MHLELLLSALSELRKVTLECRQEVFDGIVTDVVSNLQKPRVCFHGL